MSDTPTLATTAKHRWVDIFRNYLRPRMLGMLSLGFASGLPYMLIYSELAFWMKKEGVDLSVIGFFAWIGMAYTLKVLWAPVVDRLEIPWLTARMGHRRSWMLLAITGTVIGMLVIASADPSTSVMRLVIGAVILATSGATLDISIDAWRIEAAPTDEQTNMAASYVLGYRLAIWGSGLSYIVAGLFNWNIAYVFMAAVMALNGCVVFFIQEPSRELRKRAANAKEALVENIIRPFFGFVERLGVWTPVVFLLVATYLISDKTMGPMAKPMYQAVGYTEIQVGLVSSMFGPWPVIIGGFVAGAVSLKLGLMRCLLIGSALMVVTNGAFAWLSTVSEPKTIYLFVTVGADNLAAGFAATVFIAYLSSLCDLKFAATQYAFLSAMFNLIGKTMSGFTGMIAEKMGFEGFFIFSALLGVPAIILALILLFFGPDGAKGIRNDPPLEPSTD
ncbi:MFS transporter [Algimonas ampicilliniresistens]|uniref:MFS transporter n=1 Tax=Algimonas ampicilliniresistens TaxID=1298735 RepID=A0ABQ5VAJ3_9PROT|nr:MFS transporter [Algimonas ampicilliniresistens]GLQ24448.1 MFS transporter [Algimonas ampicilliniresistens]